MVARPTQVSPDAATQISHDAPTAVHMPTPLSISNLPGGSLSLAPDDALPSPRSRGRGLATGLALGAVGLAGVAFVLSREPPPVDEPARAVVTPSPVVEALRATAIPTAAIVVASEPARPAPASATASAPALALAPVATVAASAAPKPRARPSAVPALVPERPARPAAASPEDAPPAAESDAVARGLAADVDRDLSNCRCGPAARLMDQLAAAPRGGPLAAARTARVAACRPVDIDHRCVQGRLVEVE